MKTLILRNMVEVEKALGFSDSRKINFIPTMGNLHDGHFELIRKAKKNRNINLVSIYVNPLQFNDKKDLDTYPRSLDMDLKNLTKFLDKKYSSLREKLGNIGENKLLLITAIQVIDDYFDLKKRVTSQKDSFENLSTKLRGSNRRGIQLSTRNYIYFIVTISISQAEDF